VSQVRRLGLWNPARNSSPWIAAGWKRVSVPQQLIEAIGTQDVWAFQKELSVSHRTNAHPPEPGRYPTWDEIKEVRYLFCPPDATMAQLLPPVGQFVNIHETTFHLWEVPNNVWD
jgi:hypothetical protein